MELLLRCPQLNTKFAQFNKDNLLLLEAQIIGAAYGLTIEQHLNTSCIVTAKLIRWLVCDEWLECTAETLDPAIPIYQVIIGEDYGNEEHCLTVVNNEEVYQSYWRNYTITKTVIPNIKDLLANINKSETWQQLTTIAGDQAVNLKCYYYQPKTYNLNNIPIRLARLL